MYCTNCGGQIPDGTKFCIHCGANLLPKQQFPGGSDIPPYNGEKLREDRGIVLFSVLSFITYGIYAYYYTYKIMHDINVACGCENEEEQVPGMIAFILLSFFTIGGYAIYWVYKLESRMLRNAYRYGMTVREKESTLVLLCLLGYMTVGIGSFVAMGILTKNSNKICQAYNRAYGL